MSQSRVKWGQVARYFEKRGYTIVGQGGDKIIIAPKDGKPRSRQTVLIGHKCCNHAGDELFSSYVSAIKRAFNVTAKDILND